jgi:hypothetical protein
MKNFAICTNCLATEKTTYGMNFISDGSADSRHGVRAPDGGRKGVGEARPPEVVGQPVQGRSTGELPDLRGWPQRGCSGEFGGHAPSGEHSSGRDSADVAAKTRVVQTLQV